MKKTIYKTVFLVEILHEREDNPEDYTLSELGNEISYGNFSGRMEVIELFTPLIGIKAVNAIKKQGSDPEFFGMDDKGNELDND